ncbi:uncharacterized protein TM35_000012690 [Trypanosoma theileri]|uniref:Uncharacterized protein n=1 Tax=Trypanosoma theileri TaxID=67003 RepID=A0A1X0P8Z0_9TRYP|nr:uncharacterized protein TM35_000012690 [Trypanosoma theileri]ORC93392.1 hypothetical protein TM35_000012690 [Trypanosoma theileri]
MEEKDSFSNEHMGEFVTDAISSLLQPATCTAEVMQRALMQQQLLYKDIESLNNELQEAQGKFNTINNTQRHELDNCCTRVARCRSDVAVLFRQLIMIKQRLLRVKEAILKQKEEGSTTADNVQIGTYIEEEQKEEEKEERSGQEETVE